MNIDLEKDLEKSVEQYREQYCGINWSWRKGQKEIILKILNAYYNGVESVVAECPTGSGKSHIAMCVAWVLNKKGQRGYILASDVALQDQYEEDLTKMRINWGSVKGIDRYICPENDECISLGKCKVYNKSPKKMKCYDTCPYYSQRDKASVSKTAVLNYAYWILQLNYVYPNIEKAPFDKRDFVICDEAHKITDIIQSHFSPKIDKNFEDKILKTKRYLNNNLRMFKYDESLDKIIEFKKMLFENEDKLTLLKILNNIKICLSEVLVLNEVIDEYIKEFYPKMAPPANIRSGFKLADYIKDVHCKLCDYVTIISNAGISNLIKNSTNKEEIIFNCLQEKYMMNKFFHENKNFTVYLSATIGSPKQYFADMNIPSGSYYNLPSSFNFSKSPIYFYNKRRMSFNKMSENLPWLIKKVNEVLNNHPNDKGIIHSASYDLTMKIHEGLSKENQKRIVVYNGAEEKQTGIDKMNKNGNFVLMGPSLLEGVNLPDDKCRFLIIAKVPYLSLGDKFVKAKLEESPNWYQSKAIISILQGVGRGVRSETDYCDTYILDGNFVDLLSKNRDAFSKDFIQRIVLKSGD